MALKKLERCCRTGPEYRLATVEEAVNNLEWIKRTNLLEKWDRARLLDGWMGGAGYDWHVQAGFRSCLGYMLVVEVQSTTSEISNTGESNPALYSEVAKLSEEGKSAALFLCCEDWNYEVLRWLIEGRSWSWGIATSVDAEIEKASKLVSAVARELHAVLEKSRVPKSEFSCASMRALMISIEVSVRDKIGDNIVSKALLSAEVLDIGDQCWEKMGLTEDLERFGEVALNSNRSEELSWEAVANAVCCFAEDVMGVVIVRECCELLIDPVAERKMMDDHAFLSSVIAYGHEHLNRNISATDNLGKFVEAAAREAAGSCKRFIEMFRDRGYGTFTYHGSSDVVNAFLVQAAKKGNVRLVKKFIESGVKPSGTDDKRRKTALHHAAKLEDESKGLEIARQLLTEESGLPNAVDLKGRSPLHRAAFCGHAEMCRLLLRHSASVTSMDANDHSPLHHALLRGQQNEGVVRALILESGKESAGLVDVKDKNGKTPLHFAVEHQGTNVSMVAWLLSLSSEPQSYVKNLNLSLYLRESSRKGYLSLVAELLKGGADPLDPDNEGKTSFHHAAEGAVDTVAWDIIISLSGKKEGVNEELVKARDKYGRNVLHVAAFLGHKHICSKLLEQIPNIDTKDRDGQSAIYYAVAGHHDNNEVLDIFIFGAQGRTSQVLLKDDRETTPLHVAAGRGNLKMVEKLLSDRALSRQKRIDYVRAPDVLGQTALHKAAGGGHKQIVKKLLDEGAHPLKERDCDGRTALHFATKAKNSKNAMAIAKLLLQSVESDKEKILLLYASAVGIGPVEKSLSSDSLLKDYLEKRKDELQEKTGKENLLRVAARLGNIDMTSEFLTRGANIALIRNRNWIDSLSEEEKKNVEYVLEQIDNIVERGADKPALSDNLGRGAFANGLAALFLNPFVKPPITVGISGEWGMGKSSLMIQTESILIMTAAQLAFSYSFHEEDFPGATKPKLSNKGKDRLRKIEKALESLQTEKHAESESKPMWQWLAKWRDGLAIIIQKIGMFIRMGNKNSTAKGTDPKNLLYDFLRNYQPRYREIFKSLAVMDRHDMFEAEEENEYRNKRVGLMPWEEDSMQGITPSILTVRYNAWQYRNESEALAGLVVEVTKELEATMTVAHKLRTSWRYNWTTRRNIICFGVILPCFLAAFLVIWLTTIVWLLLDRAQNEDMQKFKYGSLPASVIALVWAVVKSVVSSLKPISAQIVDYICLPDHRQQLGYHQKVSFDINFLKNELSHEPLSRLWKVFAFIWCCMTFTRDGNSLIPKTTPASKDNLRIVVFIDDLDRCQENVILEILSAVNMVLAACEINVILGMDKSMIERAIIRKFGGKNSKPNKSSQDLADKYLRKIIQLPLDLPDPSDSESQHFLQGQLGMSDTGKETTGSESQNERSNAYKYKKLNPKYQMGTSIPTETKLGNVAVAVEKTKKSQAEAGAIQERTRNIKDTGRTEFPTMELETTIGKPGTEKNNSSQWHKFRSIWGAVWGIGTFLKMSGNHRGYARLPVQTTDVEQGADACENDQNAGVQKQQEESENERRLLNLSPITTEMLVPKYSEGEKNAFRFLHTRSTRSRKPPREWKCLLTYHRLAWNILSKSPEVIPLEGWQVQLIAWVFVCWQWKHLITTLVQNWHDLGVLRAWVTEENSGPSLREIVEHYIDERWPADKNSDSFQGDSATKNKEDTIVSCVEKKSGSLPRSPIPKDEDSWGEDSLKDMIRKVLREEREKKRGYSLKIKGLQRSKKAKGKHKEQGDVLKLAIRKVLQEEKEVEDMLKVIIKRVLKEEKEREKQLINSSTSCEEENKGESCSQQGTTVKENQKASDKAGKSRKSKAKDEEEEREEWRKLRETLSRYNVSMDGIQAFQKFRFYCDPGHLPWPFPKHA